MHYLDNASTTKPCPEAVAAAVGAMENDFGNPSSLHSLGRASEEVMEHARNQVAAAIGAKQEEIFFTSGGTEADNWALFSGSALMRRKGTHIITTSLEHEAILNACKSLEAQGFTVTYLDPGPDGVVSAEAVKAALRPETVLVSVMLVNNESGAVMPLKEIKAALKEAKSSALLHSDGVQALMKVPVNVKELGIDLLSLSAHKIHGAKGCGALYIKSGIKLPPFIYGGGQENGLRSGTQPVPTIAAFGAACEAAMRTFPADSERMAALKASAIEKIKAAVPDCYIINGAAPHILTLCMPGCPSQPVLNLLAEKGIFVSAGSACSKGKRSHVLSAMGVDPKLIDCAVRVSLCRFTTEEDIDAAVAGLSEAKARFSRSAGRKSR